MKRKRWEKENTQRMTELLSPNRKHKLVSPRKLMNMIRK